MDIESDRDPKSFNRWRSDLQERMALATSAGAQACVVQKGEREKMNGTGIDERNNCLSTAIHYSVHVEYVLQVNAVAK